MGKNKSLEDFLDQETHSDSQDAYNIILKNLQANIIKPHRKKHAFFIFITFNTHQGVGRLAKNRERAINWIQTIPLTSAFEKAPQDVHCLYLSYEGHQYFEKFEERPDLIQDNPFESFKKGLMNQTIFGNTQNASQVEENYKKTIHALYFIATDDKARFVGENGLINQLSDPDMLSNNGMAEIFMEEGSYETNTQGKQIEWFGFRDGISNPRFFPDMSKLPIAPQKAEAPAKLNTVLLPDKNGMYPYTCSSFMAFLKIQQDIEAFEELTHKMAIMRKAEAKKSDKDHVKLICKGLANRNLKTGTILDVGEQLDKKIDKIGKAIAKNGGILTEEEAEKLQSSMLAILKNVFRDDQIEFDTLKELKTNDPERYRKIIRIISRKLKRSFQLTEEEVKYAEASLIGRFKDGTPLSLSEKDGLDEASIRSNFSYQDKQDGKGLKCPFHAHIRKANPRTKDSEDRRIVRRSMLYGKKQEAEKGMLFVSFQSDLNWQFEELVNRWLYQYDPRKKDAGKDPILFFEKDYKRFRFPKNYGEKEKINLIMKKPLITFRGGLYFLAPSIPFFKNLKY